MAKYIDAEKLKAEIKRLEEMDYPCDTLEQSVGFYEALNCVKSFINSLQQEQPEVDLEKELQAFLCNYDYEFDDDAPACDIARHFYELGLKAKEGIV